MFLRTKNPKFKFNSDVIAPTIMAVLALPSMFDLAFRAKLGDVFAPWTHVQFNAALACLLLGLVFYSQSLNKWPWAKALATFVLGLASATIVESLSGMSFGIDQLFRGAHNAVLNAPGRMAPGAAVSLIALSLACLINSRAKVSATKTTLVAILSILPTAAGLLSLIEHFVPNFASADAGSFSHIAPPVACALLVAGLNLISSSIRNLRTNVERKARFVPVVTTLALLSVVIAAWQFQLHREMAYHQERVNNEAERVALEINETLKQTSLAMKRYASRIAYLGTKDRAFLALDSRAYLEQLPILRRIGVIDTKYRVVWSYPEDIGNQVQGFDESLNRERMDAMQVARETRAPAISRVLQLRSGGAGFMLPAPLFVKDKFSGFAYATIEAERLFHSFISTDDFQVVIHEGEKLIFKSGTTEALEPDLVAHYDLTWGKSLWQVEIMPTVKFINTIHSRLPYFILFFGSFISLLLGGLLYSLSQSREEALRNTETTELLNIRLNVALQAAQMAAWNVNLKTGESWRSEHHAQIFGIAGVNGSWSVDQLFALIVPEDREHFQQQQKIARGLSQHEFEYRIHRGNDNSLRWLRVITKPIFDESGNPQQLVGLIRDITDQKHSEVERQSALELRNAMINSSNYAIISTDANGLIKTFNQAAVTLLGYSPDEVIGKANPGLFHVKEEVELRALGLSEELNREVKPGFDSFTAKAREERIADENEWTFARKDGSLVPVSLSVTVLCNSDGEITGYLGVALDLTEKRKSQEQLMLTSERLARVIEASEEGIWEREYQPNGRILFMDDQGKRAYGLPLDKEPLLEQIYDLILEEDRQPLSDTLARHFHDNSAGFETEFRKRDIKDPNLITWIRTRGKILKKPTGVPILVSTIRDVTQEIEKREQLKKALVDAQAATVAKSNFLANMSHEIRTPLNGVIGMTRLLLNSGLTDGQHEYAETIQRSAEILLSLLNDILDFSKIEASKLDLEVVNFDLNQVVKNIERLLEFSANLKGIQLVHTVSPALTSTVFKGDPNRIGQIMANLISNAIKFTAKGKVSVTLGLDPNLPENLRIEVQDTGIGMSDEAVAKMFQPFSQADASTSRRFGGTGLGLSICKRLCELMGGTIGVDSEEGVGSTFWFTLKLEKGESASATNLLEHKATARDTNAPKFRILLAEDNEINQLIAIRILEQNGFEVDAVNNGNEALAALRSAPYDLLLMDCQMPELDGYETTVKIRQDAGSGFSKIPIVAMTANALNGDREKCLMAGMDDYVTKPFDLAVFLSVINKFVTAAA